MPTQEGDLGGEKSWYSKFAVQPVTDPTDLVRLRLLFKYAMDTSYTYENLKADYSKVGYPTDLLVTSSGGSSIKLPTEAELKELHTGNWYVSGKLGSGGKFPPMESFRGTYNDRVVWVETGHEKELSLLTLYVLGYATANTARLESLQLQRTGPLLVPN